MHKLFQVNLLGAAVVTVILSGCGDVKTTIVKKESVEVPSESNNDSDYAIESMGRLAILSSQSADLSIFDLDNGNLLESFALTHSSNTLTASPSYRYAVINSRNQNYVGFIDGGLWREDHVAHQHDYAQTPLMSAYELTGSAPTHLVKHDGQMAIFYDGNAEQGTPASVQVATDIDITNESAELATINYDINMHGVAEPRGEHLLASVRRDDSQARQQIKFCPIRSAYTTVTKVRTS
ncbi:MULTISPECIES: hypothetical protein [Pseudoalteromonas]|uniref:hypothetical protein n=1 Tax=Pseudoalteromonas TaxID=53246 RepID=UPI000AE10AE6